LNLAQIIGEDSRIDPDVAQAVTVGLAVDRCVPDLPSVSLSPAPKVTVRAWDPAKQRHEELYVGPMRFAHIRTFANERTAVEVFLGGDE
jgi:hypothetical protein